MLATLYTSYHTPKMYRQWDSEHSDKPNNCGVDMTSIMCHSMHVTIWLKCYPQNFRSVDSICESNIFMLKSQTS